MKVDNKKARFSDADWFKIGPQDIIVGGAGGIGSWLVLFLSRIGHNIFLYDMDNIDETNMAGQLYKASQIGQNKAVAAKTVAAEFCSTDNIKTFGEYTEKGFVAPIMISCFDNMAARKLMFEAWAALEERELFIDTRMLAEVGNVITVQKGQEDLYRALLFDDNEIEEAPCSFKATSHCGAIIGSLAVNTLNSYLTNKSLGFVLRPLIFKLDFELPMVAFSEDKSALVLTQSEEEVCQDS